MSSKVPAVDLWRSISRIFGARPGVIQAAKAELSKPDGAPEKWPLGEVAGATICLVNGDAVKKRHEMDFVEGGNGEAYSFIPKNEIWVDVLRDASTLPHIAYHEAVEWWLMRHENLSYEKAHGMANDLEYEKLESGQLMDIFARIDADACADMRERMREDLRRAGKGSMAAYVARLRRRTAQVRPKGADGLPAQTSGNLASLSRLMGATFGVQ